MVFRSSATPVASARVCNIKELVCSTIYHKYCTFTYHNKLIVFNGTKAPVPVIKSEDNWKKNILSFVTYIMVSTHEMVAGLPTL